MSIDWENLRKPLPQSPNQTVDPIAKALSDAQAQHAPAALSEPEAVRRAKLAKACALRTPIPVLRDFQHHDEVMENQQDDPYFRGASVNGLNGGSNFRTVLSTVRAGDVLTFQNIDPVFGQMVFKSSTGRVVCFYTQASLVVSKSGSPEANVGLQGLLYCTDLG